MLFFWTIQNIPEKNSEKKILKTIFNWEENK